MNIIDMLLRSFVEKVEVLVLAGSPISPSHYKPYKLNEEDRRVFRLPSLRYVLPSNERQIILIAIRNNPKVPFGQLASSLYHQIISNPCELTRDHRVEAVEPPKPSQIREGQPTEQSLTRPEARFYIPKSQGVRNTLIYATIFLNNSKDANAEVRITSSNGELLMSFSNLNVEDFQNNVFKKLLSVFKEGNLVLIRAIGNLPKCIDCNILERLVKSGNQFVYVQKNLQVMTTEVYVQEEHKVFEVLLRGSHATGVYLVQLESGEQVLLSKGALRLNFHNCISQLMNNMAQKGDSIGNDIEQLRKAMEYADIPLELLETIHNCITRVKCKQGSSEIKSRIRKLLEVVMEQGKSMRQKEKDDKERSVNAHFPQKIKNCKKCRVCQKQAMEELNGDKAPENKVPQAMYMKRLGPTSKIRKSKYRCEGCSLQYGKDVVICVTCFKPFHRNIAKYMDMEVVKAPNKFELELQKPKVKENDQEENADAGLNSLVLSNDVSGEQLGIQSLDDLMELKIWAGKIYKVFEQLTHKKLTQKEGDMQVMKSEKDWEPPRYP